MLCMGRVMCIEANSGPRLRADVYFPKVMEWQGGAVSPVTFNKFGKIFGILFLRILQISP